MSGGVSSGNQPIKPKDTSTPIVQPRPQNVEPRPQQIPGPKTVNAYPTRFNKVPKIQEPVQQNDVGGWLERNLSLTGLKHFSTTANKDISNAVEYAPKHVASALHGAVSETSNWAKRNLSETGLDNSWHDSLGGMNTAAQIINGFGAYAGAPNSVTGNKGKPLTYLDTLQGLGMYDPNKPSDGLGVIGNVAETTGSNLLQELTHTIKNAVHGVMESTAASSPHGPGYWKNVTEPGRGTFKMWFSANEPGPTTQEPWDLAVHSAMGVANKLFDTPQHMYRAAVLAYQQHGWDGVAAILGPSLLAAAAGSFVGNPELGGVVAESTALGATAAEGATTAVAGEAGTTAASAATAAAEQAAVRAAQPTVADDLAMQATQAGTKGFLNSPIGIAARAVGVPVKSVAEGLSSPAMTAFQMPNQLDYFTNGPIGDIWRKTQTPSGNISTIGRGLSELVYGKPNTWLSGTTDAVASLTAMPFEFGRALGIEKTAGRVLTASDSIAVDRAFAKSSGYKRAIDQIMSMARGEYGPEVQKNVAGAITRAMPTLEPIAKDIADAASMPGATAYDVSKRIGELADQGAMVQTNLLPTVGLYGLTKARGQLSDNPIPSYFSRVFGQSPMSIDDLKQIITTGTIRLGEANSGYKLGQLLQQTGMRSSDVTRLVNDLVTSNDVTKWENLTKAALKENFWQRIDRRLLSHLNLDTPEFQEAFRRGKFTKEQEKIFTDALNTKGLKTVYDALRKSVNSQVEALVGSSGAGGRSGLFVVDGQGKDASLLDDHSTAAVTENQRGELTLPDYRAFDDALSKIFRENKKMNSGTRNFADTMGHIGAMTNENLDSWVNDQFFKPLALLTPGWAFRVSLSEIALNSARLGPLNFAAGRLTGSMLKQQREAFREAQKYSRLLVDNLEKRISRLEKHIEQLDHPEAVQLKQEELHNLQLHVDWLRSKAGTEKPLTERANVNAGKKALVPPPPAQFVSDYLSEKGYKVSPTEADNLHMLARGTAIGATQAMITAIGKDKFIKNTAYLMYRHGGYLPAAVSSIHQSMLSNVDMSAEMYDVIKYEKTVNPETGLPEMIPKLGRQGKIKTKMVLMNPKDFAESSFGHKGYFEGWFYGAHTLAGSELLTRPLAKIYLDLYNEGYRGIKLRQQAVVEAQRLIEALPKDVRVTMARNSVPGMNEDVPLTSWAGKLVDKLEGIAAPSRLPETVIRTEKQIVSGAAAKGVTQTVHTKLLSDIANNNLPTHVNGFYREYAFNETGKQLPEKFFPVKVISRTPQLEGKSKIIERISTEGHSKVLGPIVNYLSRQPTFVADFVLERDRLEKKVVAGILTADQADVIAETTATRRMVRFIHNPSDKTKFEEMMSTVAPFYFAQNQAWRRMGRLFAENPGAFMQYAAVMMSTQNLVTKITNQNGISLVTIPSASLFGLPFTASLSSLQTMDAFSPATDPQSATNGPQTILDYFTPKFGPVVTVPTKLLYWAFPEWDKNKVGAIVGRNLEGNIGSTETTAQFLFQSAIPNSIIRNLVELPVGYALSSAGIGGTPLNFIDNAYIQSVLEAMRYQVTSQSKQYYDSLNNFVDQNGKKLTPFEKAEALATWQQQHWNQNKADGQNSMASLINSSRQQAGLAWLAKMAAELFSPVSISTGNSDQAMVTKLNNYVKNKKYKGDYYAAVDAFTKDNPYATIDTMSKSKSTFGGVYAETRTMDNWLSQNQNFVQQNPLGAMAFAPDMSKDTKYYQPANTLLINLGLRQKESPQDFINQFEITSGNQFFYNWIKPQYTKYINEGVKHSDVYKWEQSMIQWYGGNFNPKWMANYNAQGSSIVKLQTMSQIQNILASNPKLANTQVGQGISYLLEVVMGKDGQNGFYKEVQDAIKSGKITSADAKKTWQDWLDGFIKNNPFMKQAVLSSFYNLG